VQVLPWNWYVSTLKLNCFILDVFLVLFLSILSRIVYFIKFVILWTGYLACARCSTSGVCLNINPISASGTSVRPLQVPTTKRCPNCSGAGKVQP